MAAALSLGCSLLDLALAIWVAEEPEGQLGPGRLAPSATTAGQGLGVCVALGNQLRSASSQPGPGPRRVKVVPQVLACSCQNRE